jgi:hypothetical protein
MAVVPDTRDFGDTVVTSSEMNTYVRDPIRFALNPPRAQLRQTVLQAVANSTFVPITFDVEDLDQDPSGTGGHSTSVNTSRFTAVYAGWYFIGGAIGFAANVTGQRVAAWSVNGSILFAGQSLVQATGALGNKTNGRGMLVYLNVTDYLELQAFQTSGGALNSNVATGEQSSMAVVWESN